MGKVHQKNGFEYKCERSNYGGHWEVYWYYKPLNQKIFLPYSCINKEKTLKVDLEKHLSEPEKALNDYSLALTRASNIELAEEQLRKAREHFDYVYSPEFDLRGNNPNRETRARERARFDLYSAENALDTAIKYTNILKTITD